MYIYIYIYRYIYIQWCTHMYMYTYICIYTYIYRSLVSREIRNVQTILIDMSTYGKKIRNPLGSMFYIACNVDISI